MRASQNGWLLFAGLAMLLYSGCSGASSLGKTGSIAGQVTFEGKPITGGSVIIRAPASSESASAKISTDGKYELASVPVGQYQIAVVPPDAAPPGAPNADEINAQRKLSKIPRKYHSVGTSGISINVTVGSNPMDIILK